MPVGQFLRQHWQKKPLLVRNAYPGFRCPIEPGELAGLACEAEVESRLVLEQGGETPWQLRHGPFTEQDFTSLPATHWTLLLQELNKYIPEAAQLLDGFGFIPGWRVDDLMASYAADQGSVGPHSDKYDVFLIQAWGRRRWQISEDYDAELLPDTDLRLLAQFQPQQEWLLEPGDMLYLPPGVAHHGVADGACMTFSVGFRAPALQGLVEAWAEHRSAALDPDLLYADPDLQAQPHSAAISPQALAQIRTLVRDTLSGSDTDIDRWFGRQMSLPQRGEPSAARDPAIDPAELLARLHAGEPLWRSDYSRFTFIEHNDTEHRDTGHRDIGPSDIEQPSSGLTLFVDGRDYRLPASLLAAVDRLTSQRQPDLSEFLDQPEFVALLTELYNHSALYFADDD
jgi:50S ribosomal protein L16 3-hydroxylase